MSSMPPTGLVAERRSSCRSRPPHLLVLERPSRRRRRRTPWRPSRSRVLSSFQAIAPGSLTRPAPTNVPGCQIPKTAPVGSAKTAIRAEVHHVHRLGDHGAAGLLDRGRGRVGVVDRDVGGPGRRLALLHQRHHPGDGLAVLHRLAVAAGLLGVLALRAPPSRRGRRRTRPTASRSGEPRSTQHGVPGA